MNKNNANEKCAGAAPNNLITSGENSTGENRIGTVTSLQILSGSPAGASATEVAAASVLAPGSEEKIPSRRVAGFVRRTLVSPSSAPPQSETGAEEIYDEGKPDNLLEGNLPLRSSSASLPVSRFQRPPISLAEIEKAVEGALAGLAETETKSMTSFRAPAHVDVFYKSLPARLQINCPHLKYIPTQDIFGLILETVMTDEETRCRILLPVLEHLCRTKG